MRARLAGFAVAGVLTAFLPGCDSASTGTESATDADTTETGRDRPAADAPSAGDASSDGPANIDQGGTDRPAGGGDTRLEVPPADSAAGCATQTVSLGRGGTTSSCSFPVSMSISRDRVNLLFGGARLCLQGSNNCSARGGWFWSGDEVALCDDTCLSWEASGALLVLEAGCPSDSCFVACQQEGGRCGDGVHSCCAGWRCTADVCATCAWGGQACAGTSECCTGTCHNGTCVGGLGGACVSPAGCSQGECREGRCQCAADEILCNSGCVSYTDPNNCRGCGNICAAGTGRVCTVDGCVCDPQSGFPDECNGSCVNRSNDRDNCGFCFYTCPRLDQVCSGGVCGCPAGTTDCNGSCFDTSTSQNHCGMCNRGCPAGTEVCSSGTCVCTPGLTRCSGSCVNLISDKYNCKTCGVSCPGNKTCNNGVCG